MTACIKCPQGKTAIGPTSCSESATITSNSALNALVDGNSSFYLIVIGALLSVALAFFIDRVKKTDVKGLVQMKFFYSLLAQFALLGGSLVSEFILASSLVNGVKFAGYGAAIFVSRLLHLLPTGLVVYSILFTHNDQQDHASIAAAKTPSVSNTSFKNYLQEIHFFQNSFPYSLLLFLCLVEAPLLQYLPWRASPFANVAGFPNLILLRFALVIKSIQNIIVLYCQFIVLAATSSSSSLLQLTRTFLYINVALTFTIAVLGLLEGYLKRSLLAGTQLSIEPSSHNDNNNDGISSAIGLELRESTINPLGRKIAAAAAGGGIRDTIPCKENV